MKPFYVSHFPKLPIVQANQTQAQPNQIHGNIFSNHLKDAIQQQSGLKMSKHAIERMNERGIRLDEASWSKLQSKVLEAKQLGLKESLVLMENSAFIVSVNNQTIITAMSRKEANEQIFTNITGTIVLE